MYYNRDEANKRKGGNALLTTYIEVSRENGFVLLVYDNPHEPLFGIRFDPDSLDELIEEGRIKYKVKMDSLLQVEEVDTGETLDVLYNREEIDPFD